jgi:hypothetical protein
MKQANFNLHRADTSEQLQPEARLQDLVQGGIVKLRVKLIGECVLRSVFALLCRRSIRSDRKLFVGSHYHMAV